MVQKVFDAHGVVLEDINSKMDVLVEGFTALESRLTKVERRVEKMSSDVTILKIEMGMIRYQLEEKPWRSDLHVLERRITKLERQLAR